jgi:hypothetical protein
MLQVKPGSNDHDQRVLDYNTQYQNQFLGIINNEVKSRHVTSATASRNFPNVIQQDGLPVTFQNIESTHSAGPIENMEQNQETSNQ